MFRLSQSFMLVVLCISHSSRQRIANRRIFKFILSLRRQSAIPVMASPSQWKGTGADGYRSGTIAHDKRSRACDTSPRSTQAHAAEATGEHLDLAEKDRAEGENWMAMKVSRGGSVRLAIGTRAWLYTARNPIHLLYVRAYIDRVSGTRRSEHRYPNWNVRKSRRVLSMRCVSGHSLV